MDQNILRRNMANLCERAQKVRNDAFLRHIPNEHDITLANQNAKDLELATYQTIMEVSK